ncbi:hypothetical protein HMPREF3220_04931 [Citrobacter koseri]|nr:hypothetical protein HMPREF3220_04931 [Citrobacter koseri]
MPRVNDLGVESVSTTVRHDISFDSEQNSSHSNSNRCARKGVFIYQRVSGFRFLRVVRKVASWQESFQRVAVLARVLPDGDESVLSGLQIGIISGDCA